MAGSGCEQGQKRGITKGCTRSTHSGGCEVVRLSFVPGEPRRYAAYTLVNSIEVVSSQTNGKSCVSIRDILVFTAIASVAVALFVQHNPLAQFAFLAAIYFVGWRLLNINAGIANRIAMMALAIIIVSPLLLWYSPPERRAFNIRIGYQWGGSYLYPFFSLLPIPLLSFIYKCFRPKLTNRRYVIESGCECLFVIPLYTLLVLGI